jgi:hypothetical protein
MSSKRLAQPTRILERFMTLAPLDPKEDPSEKSRMLVNKLSVADARRLMKLEGVELDGKSFAREIVFTAVFALASGWAVFKSDVSAWHLLLPLVASWAGLVTSIPIVYLIYRHPAIKVEALKSLANLAVAAGILGVVVYVHAAKTQQTFSDQLSEDYRRAVQWVKESGMHWAMIIAYFNIVASMPSRVHNLMQFGPPFAAVGIGCAMQAILMVVGVFALPLLIDKPRPLVWSLWGLLLFANLLSLYMHWDVGKRLRRYDAERTKKQGN